MVLYDSAWTSGNGKKVSNGKNVSSKFVRSLRGVDSKKNDPTFYTLRVVLVATSITMLIWMWLAIIFRHWSDNKFKKIFENLSVHMFDDTISNLYTRLNSETWCNLFSKCCQHPRGGVDFLSQFDHSKYPKHFELQEPTDYLLWVPIIEFL